MTIEQFRREPNLQVEWAKELQNNKLLVLVLNIMGDAHPANHAAPANINQDISPTGAAIELGLTKGYALYDGRLRLLGQPLSGPLEVPESEYLPEEPEEEKPKRRK